MKNLYKKLLALTMIATIVLMFSIVPAIATENPPTEPTEPTAPTAWTSTSSAADRTWQTITAIGISESGVTVTAYQIVKGTYKDDKFTGYVKCAGLASVPNIDNFDYVSPSSDCITKIANYIEGHPTAFDSVQMTGSGSTYTATVEAGEYIILVRKASNYTGSLRTVYNPAVVAVNVNDANLIASPITSGGTVNMRSQFSFGPTAYMKSSRGDNVSKYIIKDDNTTSSRNSASFGDTVNFKIDNMTIPSYSEDYTSVQYTITDNLNYDNLSNSPFLGVSGLTVKVGTETNGVFTGSEVPQVTGEGAEAVTNYEVKYYKKNENTTGDPIVTTQDPSEAVYYEIEFADAFIRANALKNVEVTYSSTFTENAQLVLDSSNYSELTRNRTKATISYSNDPKKANSCYEQSSNFTETYTYGIDAVGDGIQTYELNKVTQSGGTYTSVPNSDNEVTKKSSHALAGATFTIYSDRAMTDVITSVGTNGTATSDANGHIEFRGLAEGTYYLKETAAPSNYTLNENNYKIVISTNSGNYWVVYTTTTYLMGETDTEIGSARYIKSGSITSEVTPAEIVNTRLATLPTTGGVGTIVISVVAGLGMAVFLTIFVISKKKKAKKIDTQTID